MNNNFNLSIEDIVSATSKNPRFFRKLSESIRTDRKLMGLILKERPQLISLMDYEIKSDKEFMYPFLRKYNAGYKFLGEELKLDKSFALEMYYLDNSVFEHFSSSLKNDFDFVLPLIKDYPKNYLFLPDNLKRNKDLINIYFFSETEKYRYRFYRYDIGKEMMDEIITPEICKKIIDSEKSIIYEIKDYIQNDKDLAIYAVNKQSHYMSILNDQLKIDKDIFDNVRRNKKVNNVFSYYDEKYFDNEDFILLIKSYNDPELFNALKEFSNYGFEQLNKYLREDYLKEQFDAQNISKSNITRRKV